MTDAQIVLELTEIKNEYLNRNLYNWAGDVDKIINTLDPDEEQDLWL